MELLPGTEVMTDVGSHHFIKGKGSDQVLVPQPSDDPHDPLNWSVLWKTFAILSASIVTIAQSLAPLAMAPMIPSLVEAFGRPLSDIVRFSGITSLVLGFSNFIWLVPQAFISIFVHPGKE